MSLLNWGGGLSAAGSAISGFAHDAGVAQQKADLEKQQMQLADQLATTRDHVGRVEAGDIAAAAAGKEHEFLGGMETRREGAATALQGAQIASTENIAEKSQTGENTRLAQTLGKPVAVAPGSELVDPTTGKSIYKSEGASLSDEALDRMADQALAGDKSVFTGLGYGNIGAQNRAKLAERITQVGKTRGIKGADLAALNAQFVGVQAGERALGTRSANLGLAANEFLQMAPLALDASDKVDRTQYPSLNALELAVAKGVGDEHVVRAMAATNSLVNIYARAINPAGVPTDSDKSHARDILNLGYSKGQFNAAVDQLQQEIGAARKAPGMVRDELRDAVTGSEVSPKNTPTTSVPKFSSPDDPAFKALPPGAKFMSPDGQVRVK